MTALLSITTSRGALGAPPARIPCEDIVVQASPRLDASWTPAIRDVQEHLPDATSTACVPMTLLLRPGDDGRVRLSLWTEDGRKAVRIIERPADVVPTVVGLLWPAAAEDAAPAPSPGTEPAPTPIGPPSPAIQETPRVFAPPVAPPSEHVQIWIGAEAGLRVGEPTPLEMVDFQLRSDVVLRRWMFVLSLRWASAFAGGHDDDSETYDEFDLGFGGAYRIPVPLGELDLGVLPSFAMMSFYYKTGESFPGGSRAELRVGALLRWSVMLNASWRATCTLDTDVAPEGLYGAVRFTPDLPPLPAWTGGLRIGLRGELL